MANGRRGGYRDEPEGGGLPPRRYARRRSGNEGLWIALGGAVVVGVVVVFIIAGSASTGALVEDAKGFMREVFRTAIEDRPREGMPMMDPREVLREQNPNLVKEWRDLDEDRKEDLRRQAFNWTRQQIVAKSGLEISEMSEVDAILAGATCHGYAAEDRVDIEWDWNAHHYNVTVSKNTGRWLFEGLNRVE